MANILMGLDEVGRGPLAGPLTVGAVILGTDFQALPEYTELRDSKKLTATKRNHLAKVIRDHAVAHGLGWVKSTDLDRLGLGPALRLAARRAVDQALIANPAIHPTEIIIDGTTNLLTGTPHEAITTTLKKADDLVKEVSAASIIAKVARDYYMTELAKRYPKYGFDAHMGYGTTAHLAALREYGPCPEHRRSFRPVAELASETRTSTKSPNSTIIGRTAECAVATFLESNGHHIIAKNFRTKSAEIDLVSTKDQQLFFTEVKFRSKSDHGSALTQITPTKLDQMSYASEVFMHKNPHFRDYQPLLAAASVTKPDFTIEDWLVVV